MFVARYWSRQHRSNANRFAKNGTGVILDASVSHPIHYNDIIQDHVRIRGRHREAHFLSYRSWLSEYGKAYSVLTFGQLDHRCTALLQIFHSLTFKFSACYSESAEKFRRDFLTEFKHIQGSSLTCASRHVVENCVHAKKRIRDGR